MCKNTTTNCQSLHCDCEISQRCTYQSMIAFSACQCKDLLQSG